MVEALCYKLECCGFESQRGNLILSSPGDLILQAALGPGVYSGSNRNKYQKHTIKCFWGVECGRCVGLTTLPPSLSGLCRQCGVHNISQRYRPPRPVTGIALLYGDGVCFL
jgi:hypothetical protein